MTNEFLQKYRELEQLVKMNYTVDANEGALWVLGGDRDFMAFRPQLNAVREIRNFLSHTPSLDGQPLIAPTVAAVRILDNLLSKLRMKTSENSVTVQSICIKPSAILTASLSDKVSSVVAAMHENGYQVVPIMEGMRVIGVFTGNTEYDDTATFADIDIDIKKNILFVGKNTSAEVAKNLIATSFKKGIRISAIFVTETGKQSEGLLGLLLPLQLI